jgi:antitoxin (DNA-binding transcriptional repressor) of toxin-antitoxin stability system
LGFVYPNFKNSWPRLYRSENSIKRTRNSFPPYAWYNLNMVAITLSEIQKNFPAYLRRVAEGEVFVITDQDRPVAELKPSVSNFRGGDISPTSDFLKGRVADARLPQRWQIEGVVEPTDDCRRTTLELTEQLFDNSGSSFRR